ncbi:MAG: RsmB/NOP family class I SAM-dependent RNA methyltransferase [Armatimonadetes bacterium]|nr:RsmB/NOP family class I SAM-dependent RNA methyltransferase [Armatimonadota bacterium]
MDRAVSRLMLKQAENLFPEENERDSFIQSLLHGESKEQALIVLKDRPEISAFPQLPRLPWQPDFVVRVSDDFRPGKHSQHDKGAFYVLDFSSVFCASAMLAIETPPKRVLDMCAAPGGKSVFCHRAFKPELLACNETIRKRMPSLISNLHRCHVEGSLVWSADPSVWTRKFPQAFDLILVDAPCSGQSMLAKGDPAPGAFSPTMIDMCVGRQRRIMGNAAQLLRPGGHILYTTCTFAIKENEKVVDWLLKQYPELDVVEVPHLVPFQSKFAEFACYRLFPHQGIGAGGFACLIRHTGEPPAHREPLDELRGSWRYGDPWSKTRPGEEEPEPVVPEPFEKPKSSSPPPKRRYIPKKKTPEIKTRRGAGRFGRKKGR